MTTLKKRYTVLERKDGEWRLLVYDNEHKANLIETRIILPKEDEHEIQRPDERKEEKGKQ